MRNANNPRHKLESSSVRKARTLYEEKGWKMAHIAIFLNVNRSSILYHIKFEGWVRRVPMARKMPAEIANIVRLKRAEKATAHRGSYAYESYREEKRRMERQDKCGHKLWSIRCACCGKILGSDSMTPDPFILEVMQQIISKSKHKINK